MIGHVQLASVGERLNQRLKRCLHSYRAERRSLFAVNATFVRLMNSTLEFFINFLADFLDFFMELFPENKQMKLFNHG